LLSQRERVQIVLARVSLVLPTAYHTPLEQYRSMHTLSLLPTVGPNVLSGLLHAIGTGISASLLAIKRGTPADCGLKFVALSWCQVLESPVPSVFAICIQKGVHVAEESQRVHVGFRQFRTVAQKAVVVMCVREVMAC
jgi:hypothetical protein